MDGRDTMGYLIPDYAQGQVLYVLTAYLPQEERLRRAPAELCKIVAVNRGIFTTHYLVQMLAGARTGATFGVDAHALTRMRPRPSASPVLAPQHYRPPTSAPQPERAPAPTTGRLGQRFRQR